MPKKLGYKQSVAIVHSVLQQTSGSSLFSGDTALGNVLGEPSQRELFRTMVRDKVRAAGFGVRWKQIPLESDVTIEHIAKILTGLAGDPGVDDD